MIHKIRNSRFLQYYAAIAATTAIGGSGMYLSWSSPSLPQLSSDDSPIGVTLTKEEGSWVSSIALLVSLVGSIMSAYVIQKFGRRGTLVLTFFPMFLPWFGVMFADSLWMLLVFRGIGGISIGLGTSACAIYNGEIADSSVRGKIASLFNLMKLVGDLIVLTSGPYVSYKSLCGICAGTAVIFILMFFWMPESPYHYVEKGRFEDARKALARFNSDDIDDGVLDKKLEAIKLTVELTKNQSSGIWELLSNPIYRRIIFIMWGVKTLQMMSGTLAMDSYLQTIIESSGSSISPGVSSIIFGVVQLPAALVATYLVDRTGRKPLLMTSAAVAGFALIAEGVYFFLQDYLKADVSAINWLPTTALVLYIIMKPLGIQSLPYVLLGEVFPNNIKGIAVSIATVYGGLLGFITMKLFEPASDSLGRYTVLWFFASICIMGSIFVAIFLPETKGKTFDEIQEEIGKRRNKSVQSLPISITRT